MMLLLFYLFILINVSVCEKRDQTFTLPILGDNIYLYTRYARISIKAHNEKPKSILSL